MPATAHGASAPGAAAASAVVQGRWALTDTIFRREPELGQRRRTQAELLLERYGIVTREQVLAEGIPGGFSSLYDALSQLETLGVCRRGYFVEGLGGAQFALPGAVERLRAQRAVEESRAARARRNRPRPALRRGAALAAARGRRSAGRARARGAYVVLAGAEPVLYVEKGGRGIVDARRRRRRRLYPAFAALAAVRHGRARAQAVAGARSTASRSSARGLEQMLIELGFRAGPRKLTLSA